MLKIADLKGFEEQNWIKREDFLLDGFYSNTGLKSIKTILIFEITVHQTTNFKR